MCLCLYCSYSSSWHLSHGHASFPVVILSLRPLMYHPRQYKAQPSQKWCFTELLGHVFLVALTIPVFIYIKHDCRYAWVKVTWFSYLCQSYTYFLMFFMFGITVIRLSPPFLPSKPSPLFFKVMLSFFIVIICIYVLYTYAYIHISILIEITCLVCILVIVCLISWLTVWHWTINCCILP